MRFFLVFGLFFFLFFSTDASVSAGRAKSEVILLQRKLQLKGLNPGQVDGVWGPKTKRALTKFQAKFKLPVTGIPDEATLKMLGIYPGKKLHPDYKETPDFRGQRLKVFVNVYENIRTIFPKDRSAEITYLKKEKKPYSGILLEKYKTGEIKLKQRYKKGKKIGDWRTWYKNGRLAKEETHENGWPHGVSRTWDKNGQLRVKANYRKGRLHGVYRKWDGNGQLVLEEAYVNDTKSDRGWSIKYLDGSSADDK
ncbi:peptidoglycan-binding protein [Candidatus Riflebacteria bacterium]